MTKYYKRRRGKENDELWRFVEGLLSIYFLYLLFLWFSNKENFWRWIIYGLIVFVFIIVGVILYKKIQVKIKDEKIKIITSIIKRANLEKYIDDFISNYGLGKQEKAEKSWNYRDYSIAWYRINDLSKFLKERGVLFSDYDIRLLLKECIEDREYKKMTESQEVTTRYFKDLSWSAFEKLLHRLYEAWGYAVQLTGRAGDQGGDLVVTKKGMRMVVQAKYYQVLVNNKAIQEAVAAKGIYNCDRATVVTTSDFTDGALELAKANNVDLINGKKLKELLLSHLKENWI